MKLTFTIATAALLLGKDSTQFARAFAPVSSVSNNAITSRAQQKYYQSTVAVAAAETETMEEMDYAAINKMTFRQLQRNCKNMGLPAKGNTATLRLRLLQEFGLVNVEEECETDDAEVSKIRDRLKNAGHLDIFEGVLEARRAVAHSSTIEKEDYQLNSVKRLRCR